ncbi:MAG: tol-pal system protein YbgF [PS1 clade bacterium]|uniref:Cell division coordinator CpoB n=1 Tax=PS1 clade bacterium TaxID=2175152 RepID=A0A937L5D8_9PROT|nr:tol-pal system protein YbgF [PS1 clade bacterium]
MRFLAALLTLFGLLASPVWAQSGPRASSEFAPRAPGSDQPAGERVDALELRIAQLEQLLEAQRTLQNRNRLAETQALRQRLELLEARLLSAQDSFSASADSTSSATSTSDAAARVQFNQLAEMLRLIQAQTDRLMIDMRNLTQRIDKASSDNEFRFQALEGGVRRANQGISSSSAEPEVIGFVKKAAPVDGLADASAVIDVTTPLVGEGNPEDLADFDAPVRAPVDDPQALYERALGDLQGGDYASARVDFAALVERFPNHKMAGHAQYWLGETFYVQRQYKLAAQAFLAGYTTYEKSKKAPDSLLKLGMTLTALGEKKTGCDAFAELGAKFPDAPAAVAKRAEIEKKRAGCAS